MNITKKIKYLLLNFNTLSDDEIIILITELENLGFDINKTIGNLGDRKTILQEAVLSLRFNIVDFLLKNKTILVNKKSELGHTALSYLSTLHINDEYKKILNLLNSDDNFNQSTYNQTKPLFVLLRNNKNYIPDDIFYLYVEKTILKDRISKKNEDDLLTSLLYNVTNFTYDRVVNLIELKKIDLNNSYKRNSLLFSIPYLNPQETKILMPIIEKINKNYFLDFSAKVNIKVFNDYLDVSHMGFAISEGNYKVFLFLIKNGGSCYDKPLGKISLINFCLNSNFLKGVKFLVKQKNFHWDNKSLLLKNTTSDEAVELINKEYSKYMYKNMNKDLNNNKSIEKTKIQKI